MVGCRFAQIFMGSGTMANDVIAAQLKHISGTGLIISNGEFGERLIDHAKSASIDFDHISFDCVLISFIQVILTSYSPQHHSPHGCRGDNGISRN